MKFQPLLRCLLFLLCLSGHTVQALYDPKPEGALAAAEGEWQGTLAYLDYEKPDKMVTLPTKLFIVLSGPNEITLHYLFDDGPGKIVHSYERMTFDFSAHQVTWKSGEAKEDIAQLEIESDDTEADVRRVVFVKKTANGQERHTLRIGGKIFSLQKEEVSAAGGKLLRNQFSFQRSDSK